jgi:hypothetical protein
MPANSKRAWKVKGMSKIIFLIIASVNLLVIPGNLQSQYYPKYEMRAVWIATALSRCTIPLNSPFQNAANGDSIYWYI